MYRTAPSPPSVSRRKPFASRTIGRPHHRHQAFRVDRAVRGPVGLDHDRGGILGSVERCRAEREEPGKVVRHDAHRRVVRLHLGSGARRAPGRARPRSNAAGCRSPACRRAPRRRSRGRRGRRSASTSDSNRPQCPASVLVVAARALRRATGSAHPRARRSASGTSMSRASVPPANAAPGLRYARGPIRLSVLRPRSTSAASAPTRSRDAGELVRERNGQGEEGVDAVLHELRRLDTHPFDAIREGSEQLFDPPAVALRPDADDDPVRSRERRDRVSEPEVLRRIGERPKPDRSRSRVVPTGSLRRDQDHGARIGGVDDRPGSLEHEFDVGAIVLVDGGVVRDPDELRTLERLLPTTRELERPVREPSTRRARRAPARRRAGRRSEVLRRRRRPRRMRRLDVLLPRRMPP